MDHSIITSYSQKIKFSIKDFFSKCGQLQCPTDLVTFTEEILNRKLHFLCSVAIGNCTENKHWKKSTSICCQLWSDTYSKGRDKWKGSITSNYFSISNWFRGVSDKETPIIPKMDWQPILKMESVSEYFLKSKHFDFMNYDMTNSNRNLSSIESRLCKMLVYIDT